MPWYIFAVSQDPAVEVGRDISVTTAVINPEFAIVDDFALCRSEMYTPLLNFSKCLNQLLNIQ